MILGDKKFLKKLDRRLREQIDVEVIVGNTANYALWVHEVQARHPVGEWKFLEKAAVTHKAEVLKIIAKKFEETHDMEAAMLAGGLLIQREAMKLTPIDTGNLRNSYITRAV